MPYFRRNIGSVFQDFRLLPSKTVAQNVAFALQVTGASRGFVHTAVPEALELVGLADKAKRMPHELSGGEQQRVAIARAIANRPDLLLADEPTGNLDPATSVEIMRLLARINGNGTTIIMATHEAGFVDQMQRRVIELTKGKLIRDESQGGYGDTSSIPKLEAAVELGAASTAALQDVRKLREKISAAQSGEEEPDLDELDDIAVVAEQELEEAVVAHDEVLAEELLVESELGVADEAAAAAEADEAEAEPTPPITKPVSDPVAESRPLTRPLARPEINVAELGVADRLGLGDFDDDEVGPTS